jgi:hypothetical protein
VESIAGNRVYFITEMLFSVLYQNQFFIASATASSAAIDFLFWNLMGKSFQNRLSPQ